MPDADFPPKLWERFFIRTGGGLALLALFYLLSSGPVVRWSFDRHPRTLPVPPLYRPVEYMLWQPVTGPLLRRYVNWWLAREPDLHVRFHNPRDP